MLGKLAALVPHLAVDSSTPSVSYDASSVTGDITEMLSSVFSVGNLKTIIIAALGITVGLIIFWFAYRFISRKVVKAMKKGSL